MQTNTITKRRDPEARREAILLSAQELIAGKGIGTVTIDDIVRQAGVAKGTFYLYFRNKDDVINAVVEQIFEHLVQDFITRAEARDIPISERLLWLVKALAELASQPGARELSMLVHQPANIAVHRRLEEKAASLLIPIMEKIISEGIETGAFAVHDPYLCARWVAGAFLGLDYVYNESENFDAAISHLCAFILRGLGYRGEVNV